MSTFDREDRMRRMMDGFVQEETKKPTFASAFIAGLLAFIMRVALAVAAVACIDMGLDGDYDLSLWGMVRVSFGGLLVIAMLSAMIGEAISRLSQR